MGFKAMLKAKTFAEYLQAKKDPELMAEIESRSWGRALSNSAQVTNQNAKRNAEIKKQRKIEKNAIRCPHCKSTDVAFMQQDKKGFSVGKAAAGAVLTGGVGTLAGFAGKKGKKQWHCQNCGNTFETK